MLLLLQPNTNTARLQYVVYVAVAGIQYLVYSTQIRQSKPDELVLTART